MEKTSEILKIITRNGLVASVYFLLTFFTPTISYLMLQIRIAELLILLCYFRRDYIIGFTVGCLLANLASPLGLWDALFGTLATFLSCLLISISPRLLIAALFPIVFNSFIIGAELAILMPSEYTFWVAVGFVALGELIVMVVGYAIFMLFGRRKNFMKVIGANRKTILKW